MQEHYLLGLAAVIVLGVLAQWLAWRLHLPSILLLLVTGIVAGPVTGFLDPDRLFGEMLLPLVSVSVAVILFEGSLSLSLADLREIGSVVRNLITLGALVNWVISTAAAYFVLRLDLPLAVLLGAILVVTGPTVILPLLRHVRPVGQVGSVMRWEGIMIDPIGAVLAVLVFEAITSAELESVGRPFLTGLGAVTLGGVVIGLVGAGLMTLFLRRYWIPDFLQNAVALMMAVAAYTASNLVVEESGLLAVTIMGIGLANQKKHPVKHIVEFKENLRVLLLAGLFILLAARLSVQDLAEIGPRSFLFLAVLMLVARPLSVLVSTAGSEMDWRQRFFLSCMAPRGIVAAAVSSVFALKLAATGYPEADRLVSETFLVIIGTVAIYGLGGFPLARALGITEPNRQGALLVGAHGWARQIAERLKSEGFEVVLVDSNWANISAARMAGFRTHFGGVLSEHVLNEINLYGIGRLIALTSNDEANSLAALHFADIFGRSEVYQLCPEGWEERNRRLVSPAHLSGRLLFGPGVTHSHLSRQVARGATIRSTKLSEKFDYQAFQKLYGESAVPLFLITSVRKLVVWTVSDQPKPRSGQTLISLVFEPDEREAPEETLAGNSSEEGSGGGGARE